MRRAVLGIDAGGQSFKVAPIDADTCRLLCDPDYIRIDSGAPSEILLESFAEIIRRGVFMSGNAGYEVEAVSFSCPGPMDYFKGISRMDHKWKSIKGISIPDYIHDKVLPPEIPVYFVHDAHSLIFGSVLNDDIKERNIAGFIIGTGLGFGIVQNGNPVTDEYVESQYIKNKVPIRLSNKLQIEIVHKANKVLNLYNHGMKNIVFPNIDKILEQLIKMEENKKVFK